MYTKKNNYIKLIIWIISLMVIGSAIGSLTKSSVDTWYLTLNRSPLTPPNYAFGIAWSILYALIAISGWWIWESKFFSQLQYIKKLFAFQLVLNWIWTPLFFYYQQPCLALICLIMIVILVAGLIIKTYKPLTIASVLLIPYLVWLCFASYLNFYIWLYN